MEHFRWLLLSFLYITNVTLITWTFTNSTWVKGFAIIIGAMQGKLKLAFTIKRPKMVKGHCLQWSPQNKIFSTFKSERIQCQEWNFCGILNKWSSCHFFFFFVSYLIRVSHFREFCDMVLSVIISTYTKHSNCSRPRQVGYSVFLDFC